LSEVETEFLLEMTATLSSEPVAVGDAGRGTRSIAIVTGGSFEGPHLKGDVLPVGGDFLVRRTDEVTQLDVRIALRTDDGADIYVTYGGVIHTQGLGPVGGPAEGERYFRTTPRFETGEERYQWLNRVVAVGVNQPSDPGSVRYRIHAVL
jgi:hypothetical protein